MMGALADAALEAGGEVIGVIPDSLMAREVGHFGLTRNEVVADMQVRKQRMIELSDAFLTLPGGLGTLDELFEVLRCDSCTSTTNPFSWWTMPTTSARWRSAWTTSWPMGWLRRQT